MHDFGYTVDPSPIVYVVLFLVIAFIYIGCRVILRKRKSLADHIFTLLFALYLIGVLKYTFTPLVLFTKYPFTLTIHMFYNIIPLKTITTMIERKYWIQIFGNIVLLLPMPIFLKLIWNHINARMMFAICLGACLCIESTQLILDFITDYPNRIADVDDVILNMLGVAVGWRLVVLLRSRFSGEIPNKKHDTGTAV